MIVTFTEVECPVCGWSAGCKNYEKADFLFPAYCLYCKHWLAKLIWKYWAIEI